MHYSTNVRPTAHISVQNNRVSHKQSNGHRLVYFPKSTEFQIELTNDYSNPVLAMIKVNGSPIGDQGLVLRPGEHIYLDRYLDSPEKFLFDIYSVDDKPSTKKAIEKNGIIEVEFYREASPKSWISVSGPAREYRPDSANIYYWSNNTTGTTLDSTWTHCSSTTSIDGGTLYIKASETYDSYNPTPRVLTDAKSTVDPQIETGRVGKGSHSDQKFRQVNMNFETFPFHSETIQILPSSRRSSNVKVYCSECGRRFRKSENYCPTCGAKK